MSLDESERGDLKIWLELNITNTYTQKKLGS